MPGRCGTISSDNFNRSSANTPPPVTTLIVNRRLAMSFAIVEWKQPSGCWRQLLARPDIEAIELWPAGFLSPRRESLVNQPSGVVLFTIFSEHRSPRILIVYEPVCSTSITHWAWTEPLFGLARYTKV